MCAPHLRFVFRNVSFHHYIVVLELVFFFPEIPKALLRDLASTADSAKSIQAVRHACRSIPKARLAYSETT
jgi:hypothetical protein